MDTKIYKYRRDHGLCVNCKFDLRSHGIEAARCPECQEKCKKYRWNDQGYPRLKQRILEAYGNKCACCGESRFEFLQVDHVRGDGAEHRREMNDKGGKNLYQWIVRNNFPKKRFQILCANCNVAKSNYGVCPHVKEKRKRPRNKLAVG